MAAVESQTLLLPTGHRMPLIGLGTWQSSAEETEKAIEAALEAGYRHIDTAFNYRNEEAIGNALRRWLDSDRGNRSQLFIVTKLPHIGMRASDVERYLTTSLKRLQLTYIDLYLIHLPFGFIPDTTGETSVLKEDGGPVLDMTTDHVAIWKAMEEQVDLGRVRALGISNLNPAQIQRVVDSARIQPCVLQVEMHALHQQRELRKFCEGLQLPLVAYSPLGSPTATAHFKDKYGHVRPGVNLIEHPTVVQVANKHGKTAAQVLLRHLVQQGVAAIPKSTTPVRILQNYQVFDFQLSDQEMQELNQLDLAGKGRIFDFLFFKGVEFHPEYPFPEHRRQ